MITDRHEWPDTEHPALTREAPLIRRLMTDRSRYAVRYHAPAAIRWDTPNDDSSTVPDDIRIMTIQRAWGNAPYVGRPFVYLWDVAIDDLGRWVAGPTRIEYPPPQVWDR